MSSKWWQGGLLGGGAALILAGAGVLLGVSATASGQGARPVLKFTPATQNAAMGGTTFTVDIKAENVSDLGTWETTIQFDENLIEYVGWSSGPFLTSTGLPRQCTGPFPAHPLSAQEAANDVGAMRFGCNTTGGLGNGPSGAGTLATVTFKTRGATGTAGIAFRGWLGDSEYPFLIREASGDVEELKGVTGLGNTGGSSIDADVIVQNAVVGVFDPSEPTPSAPPATPTPPTPKPAPNIQETAAAVLGTPAPRLSDPSSRFGVGDDTGLNPDGSVPGSSNGRSGGVAGSGSGTRSGVTAGEDVPRGPDGAPIAGHGPQQQDGSEWPQRAGMALVLAGALVLGTGVVLRRRVA